MAWNRPLESHPVGIYNMAWNSPLECPPDRPVGIYSSFLGYYPVHGEFGLRKQYMINNRLN